MRTLHLTQEQFDVLYDILVDTVSYLESDLITTEDENGNEIEESIEEYEAFKIYQKLREIKWNYSFQSIRKWMVAQDHQEEDVW